MSLKHLSIVWPLAPQCLQTNGEFLKPGFLLFSGTLEKYAHSKIWTTYLENKSQIWWKSMKNSPQMMNRRTEIWRKSTKKLSLDLIEQKKQTIQNWMYLHVTEWKNETEILSILKRGYHPKKNNVVPSKRDEIDLLSILKRGYHPDSYTENIDLKYRLQIDPVNSTKSETWRGLKFWYKKNGQERLHSSDTMCKDIKSTRTFINLKILQQT